MAFGCAKKLLPVAYKEAAEKCCAGLQKYLTPHGFLTGTAPGKQRRLIVAAKRFQDYITLHTWFYGHIENEFGDEVNRTQKKYETDKDNSRVVFGVCFANVCC